MVVVLVLSRASWTFWIAGDLYEFCARTASPTPVLLAQLSGHTWESVYSNFVPGEPALSAYDLPPGLQCVHKDSPRLDVRSMPLLPRLAGLRSH